jgi:hypothetical protein
MLRQFSNDLLLPFMNLICALIRFLLELHVDLVFWTEAGKQQRIAAKEWFDNVTEYYLDL